MTRTPKPPYWENRSEKTMHTIAIREEIAAVLTELSEKLKLHPERRADLAWQAIRENKPRRYPAFSLGRVTDISAGEGKARPVALLKPEEHLLQKLRSLSAPLALLNPVAPVVPTGFGPGTLAASFGLAPDPDAGYVPRQSLSLKTALKNGPPDPQKSGLLPVIKEEIEAIKELTPEWLKIGLPDTQGPFNISHMVAGNEVFTAAVASPEEFDAFLRMVTEFFIRVNETVRAWIGPERLPRGDEETVRIAECSVNLVSADFYERYLLVHDLSVARRWPYVDIHTCSGPHVFQVTLKSISNLIVTEAGFIEKACAGWTPVETALKAIGDRPIILRIGEELPADFHQAEERIKSRFLLARGNHRLSFAFTGMYWRKTDEQKMVELHRRLDEFWEKEVWPCTCQEKT
ncbi:MAG TPA: hypothetical protein PK644_02850 [bacterium]|nr:hypothetical protein [bacterium]